MPAAVEYSHFLTADCWKSAKLWQQMSSVISAPGWINGRAVQVNNWTNQRNPRNACRPIRTMMASDARPWRCFSIAHGSPEFLRSRVIRPFRQRMVMRINPSKPPPACNPPAPLGINAPGKDIFSVRIRYTALAVKPPNTRSQARTYNRSPSCSCEATAAFLSSPFMRCPRCRQRCCLIIHPMTARAAVG